MLRDTWHGCYDEGLQDTIIPAAFAHPAKASWALAKRIVQHALAEHWIRPGSLVLDPLAGVGVFGLALAYAGCQAVLGELENHFAVLLKQNIEKHADRLQRLGKPVPWCFRHDARDLPLGSAECVVSSPPFSIPGCQPTGQGQGVTNDYKLGRMKSLTKDSTYGTHPAQIGALRSYSQPECVVSSPPYEGSISHAHDGIDWTKAEHGTRDRTLEPNYAKNGSGVVAQKYGGHDSQIGNTTRETYFTAMKQVYEECHRILPYDSPIILVVKGFVRAGQYIDLPFQTAQLLEHVGFTVVHWHEAMLVSRESQLGLFGGEQRLARKSFFRRLAEAKGSPAIDAEIVLCAIKNAPHGEEETPHA